MCGKNSNLLVVDINSKNKGLETWASLMQEHVTGGLQYPGQNLYTLLDTFIVKTGGGGYHYYFKYHGKEILQNKVCILKKVDIRTQGGQVVAPGSIYPDFGTLYEAIDPLKEAMEMPEWLFKLLVLESNKSTQVNNKSQQLQLNVIKQTNSLDNITKLISLLSVTRAENYDSC